MSDPARISNYLELQVSCSKQQGDYNGCPVAPFMNSHEKQTLKTLRCANQDRSQWCPYRPRYKDQDSDSRNPNGGSDSGHELHDPRK